MAPLPLGSIVYLTTAVIKARIKSEETMPDTPSLYGADLDLMNDPALNADALAGRQGPDGQTQFACRRMEDPDGTPYKSSAELPTDLGNNADDIGKYWIVPTYDADGVVVEQWAWVWLGSDYRKTYMGSLGPPGPVPKIRPSTDLVNLSDDPDATSFVETSGSVVAPTWRFNVAVPVGPSGPAAKLNDYPDFAENPSPSNPAVILHDGKRATIPGNRSAAVFRPANIAALSPRFYSVPESAFRDHNGTWTNAWKDATVNVGSFSVPAQNFDWTPAVWGHTTTERFSNPWKIGLEVRLGDVKEGTLIARGFGNVRGEVFVMPHYTHNSDLNVHVSPTNGYAKVDAGSAATLHMNLTNDGLFSIFNFTGKHSQLMIMVCPLDAFNSYTAPTTRRVR